MWIRNKLENPQLRRLLSEPARVQLHLCGKKIYARAGIKDHNIELWLIGEL